jgi:hypothetical protein
MAALVGGCSSIQEACVPSSSVRVSGVLSPHREI